MPAKSAVSGKGKSPAAQTGAKPLATGRASTSSWEGSRASFGERVRGAGMAQAALPGNASADGRCTPAGHSTSSGHRSANQATAASYFRTVKEAVSFSSRRWKKRQSPRARCATVDISIFFAAA